MPTTAPEIMEACLGFLFSAMLESRNRRFDEAKRALATALVNAVHVPKGFLPDYRVALSYCTLLVKFRESPASVTHEMRSRARALLDQSEACNSLDLF